MLWLLLEAGLALALLVGVVLWVMLPAKNKAAKGADEGENPKKMGAVQRTAPAEKADLQERREEISDPSEPEKPV